MQAGSDTQGTLVEHAVTDGLGFGILTIEMDVDPIWVAVYMPLQGLCECSRLQWVFELVALITHR